MPTRNDYSVIAYGLQQRLNDAIKLLQEDNTQEALKELSKLNDALENMKTQK